MSKAQELADEFERSSGAWSRADLDAFGSDCIEELRRLEAENARLKTVPMKYRRMAFNAELQSMNDKLMADKDELLEALKRIESIRNIQDVQVVARAAIQKHGAAS